MSLEMAMKGAGSLSKKIEKMAADQVVRRERAGKAAANLLKVAMKREAPYGSARKRDSARKKARTKHLRQTITVRPLTHSGLLTGGDVVGFTVGPRSPLAHLVIRGTRARHETVGGNKHAGAVRKATLLANRQLRFNARGFAGPVFGEASALGWSDGGGMIFRHSSNPGPMPANPFVDRARALARGEAKAIVAAVLFHDAPDPNEA